MIAYKVILTKCCQILCAHKPCLGHICEGTDVRLLTCSNILSSYKVCGLKLTSQRQLDCSALFHTATQMTLSIIVSVYNTISGHETRTEKCSHTSAQDKICSDLKN